MSELLATALTQVRGASSGLKELAHLWSAPQMRPLWWDRVHGVFSTTVRSRTHRALFGSYGTLRSLVSADSRRSQIRRISRMLPVRRWRGPFHLDFPLPGDAVLIPPIPSKQGFAVASHAAGLVLKLSHNRDEVSKAIEIQGIVVNAGIQEHVPRILDHGFTDDGGEWMASEFAANTHPIHRPLNPLADRRAAWRRWLRWRILPCMERFYDASGVDTLSVDEVLDELGEQLRKDNMPEYLFRILTLAEQARRPRSKGRILRATIHKDIIPTHVHRDGDRWWILDWGTADRGMIAKEAFRDFFWSTSQSESHQAYWAWLRGGMEAERLPADLRAHVQMYLDWRSNWRGGAVDARLLRCQLLIAILLDMHEVIELFELGERRFEHIEADEHLPAWVRSLPTQLRGLRVNT